MMVHGRNLPPLTILYEDNHLLGVEKIVNVPTQADVSGDMDMLNLLKEDIKIRFNKPGNVYLGLVHRLDRPVGGAMIFAKTSKAASRLSDAVRTRKFDKTYVAVVHGHPPARQGRLEHTLLKDEKTNIVTAVPKGTPGGKDAVLDYYVLGQNDHFSLIQVVLHTGRSHQIRVQCKEMGCPLYGDQKYGSTVNKPGQQLSLWSCSVGFPHPVSKEYVQLISIPPREYPWNEWQESIYQSAARQPFV
ncbi:RluA family pseudouridine synthase [Paenibacillus gallinarum]|uniref:RNA pseudouridylate synthase n=1 Tax=Paenibacillus gallinarum TaxID=2762232 RepID=A0ABR8SX94_9BACL|nr:RluA family pseudouridine synthase [Paenibacillus gallinarum]MBD7968124.1 RluA family pseudouridine synthase [Paenibacillus gallinarum]